MSPGEAASDAEWLSSDSDIADAEAAEAVSSARRALITPRTLLLPEAAARCARRRTVLVALALVVVALALTMTSGHGARTPWSQLLDTMEANWLSDSSVASLGTQSDCQSLEPDIAYAGQGVLIHNVVTDELCDKICSNNDECAIWTWRLPSNCTIQQLEPNQPVRRMVEPGAVSGMSQRFCELSSQQPPVEEVVEVVEEATTTQEATTTPAYDCEADAEKWDVLWPRAQIVWCCEHEEFEHCPGTDSWTPFDCKADAANWRTNWPANKKKWCCENNYFDSCEDSAESDNSSRAINKSTVTPAASDKRTLTITTLQLHDKSTVTSTLQDKSTITSAAVNKITVTPAAVDKDTATTTTSLPYDCSAGAAKWEKGWSEAKKRWCCKHQLFDSCPTTTSLPYDCEAGAANWKKGWSEGKKHWCCVHELFDSCPTTTTSLPYDCAAGVSNWVMGWSDNKKRWCCERSPPAGCPQENRSSSGLVLPVSQIAADDDGSSKAGGTDFCCMASMTPDGSVGDICGHCFPGARAYVNASCGSSQKGCSDCGGQAWCPGAASPARQQQPQVQATSTALDEATTSSVGSEAVTRSAASEATTSATATIEAAASTTAKSALAYNLLYAGYFQCSSAVLPGQTWTNDGGSMNVEHCEKACLTEPKCGGVVMDKEVRKQETCKLLLETVDITTCEPDLSFTHTLWIRRAASNGSPSTTPLAPASTSTTRPPASTGSSATTMTTVRTITPTTTATNTTTATRTETASITTSTAPSTATTLPCTTTQPATAISTTATTTRPPASTTTATEAITSTDLETLVSIEAFAGPDMHDQAEDLPPRAVLSTSQPFDCEAGFNNWEAGWSDQKKLWCCDHKHKGCEVEEVVIEGYNCLIDSSKTEDDWTVKKRQWCCWHENVGCSSDTQAPAPAFELPPASAPAAQTTSPTPPPTSAATEAPTASPKPPPTSTPTAAPTLSPTPRPTPATTPAPTTAQTTSSATTADIDIVTTTTHSYDCAAGLEGWQSGWSDAKKAWCCEHEMLGCKAVLRGLMGTTPPPAVARFEVRRHVNCFSGDFADKAPSFANLTESQCKDACAATPDCQAAVLARERDTGPCLLRVNIASGGCHDDPDFDSWIKIADEIGNVGSDIAVATGGSVSDITSTAAARSSEATSAGGADDQRHKGLNCYPGAGARSGIFEDPVGDQMTFEECGQSCRAEEKCEAIVVLGSSEKGVCFLRAGVDVSKCETGTSYDLWVLKPATGASLPLRGLLDYTEADTPADITGAHADEAAAESASSSPVAEPEAPAAGSAPTTAPASAPLVSTTAAAGDATTARSAAPETNVHHGLNCFAGAGADVIEGGDPISDHMSLEECRAACRAKAPVCQGVVVLGERPLTACFLRANVNVSACVPDTGYDLWLEELAAAATKGGLTGNAPEAQETIRFLEHTQEDEDPAPSQLVSKGSGLWEVHHGKNCYEGFGAAPLPGHDPTGSSMTVEECKAACEAEAACNAIMVEHRPEERLPGGCWLQTDVRLEDCEAEWSYDLWMRSSETKA